jgi:putative heme transporter
MTYTLPGLTTGQAGVARTASLALANTVPEGGTVATGLTFAMYRSWGFRSVDSTTSIVTIGIWTNLSRYVLMSIALVILVVFGSGSGSLVWIAVASCVVVAAVCLLIAAIIVDDGFARRVGRLLTRLQNAIARHLSWVRPRDLEQIVSDFRAHVHNRVRTCWRSLTATMLVSQLLGALVLGVAVRMCGIGQDVVAAFVAPTPGGLGIAEAALIAVLGVGLASGDQAQLVAAVLLFRAATWFLPIPIGLVSYLYWRLTNNWKVPVAHSSVDTVASDLQTRSDDNGSS